MTRLQPTIGRLRFVAMVGGVGLSTLALLGASRPPVPGCQTAAVWSATYRGRLPTTLDELNAFPRSFRRALYFKLDAATQQQLWREQFARNAGDALGLTPEQRSVLNWYGSRVAEYKDATIGEFAQERDGVRPRIYAVFDSASAWRIFEELGDPSALGDWNRISDVKSVTTNGDMILREWASRVGLLRREGNCTCNLGTDWGCTWTTYCTTNAGNQCTHVSGCGSAQYGCDGLCLAV